MTLELAQKVEIGDVLIAAYNITPHFKVGDEVIVGVFISRKNTTNETLALLWHRRDEKLYEGNLQDFRFRG